MLSKLLRLTMAVGAFTTLATSATALAAVICSKSTPIAIPSSDDGIYINLVTEITGPNNQVVQGFDFNPWGPKALNFYMGTNQNGINAAVYLTRYEIIPDGVPIGPGSNFAGPVANSTNMAAWRAGVTNAMLGVRFRNEGQGDRVNYAWVAMTTTAPTGFPANVLRWCYDNSGSAIIAGTLPVQLQHFTVD